MHRRQFLAVLGSVTAAGLTMPWARALGGTPASNSELLLGVEKLPGGGSWGEIPKLVNTSSKPGLFKATLTAAPVQVPLLGGAPTEFWAYNGSLPGPLIEVEEGDTVEIVFVNRLSQPSTIHWHGLPVPPEQDGNPHDPVLPGKQRIYRFTLPMGSAGTYWYHPHPHLHTAEQAYRGLAGPFLVRSRNDPLRGIPERLLVFSDLKLDASGQIAPNNANDVMNGREGQFVLVNARRFPVLPFHPSGRERWRVWNACSARYLNLSLPGIGFTLVGTDGGLIERPVTGLPVYLLAPGQRAELVVDAEQNRNRADLSALPYQRGKMGQVPPEKILPLLTVDFSKVSNQRPAALPTQLARIDDLGPIKAKKQVVFSEQMSMVGGQHSMAFLVNGKVFDMRRIDLISKRGEVELWEIVNQSDMDHPFHLHGTQFQVLERELDEVVSREPFRAWRDTVNLKSKETVRIKTVQHFTGTRMFHCHILEHEEAGMMGQLKVV